MDNFAFRSKFDCVFYWVCRESFLYSLLGLIFSQAMMDFQQLRFALELKITVHNSCNFVGIRISKYFFYLFSMDSVKKMQGVNKHRLDKRFVMYFRLALDLNSFRLTKYTTEMNEMCLKCKKKIPKPPIKISTERRIKQFPVININRSKYAT